MPTYMNMNLQNLNFLVTGGAEGIGSSVTDLLITEGATVHILDKQSSEKNLAQLHKIDVRDKESVKETCKNLPLLDGLILNAALGPYEKDPVAIFETNVIGTLNVFNSCKDKFKTFASIIIVSSTAGFRANWSDKWLDFIEGKISFDYKSEIEKMSPQEVYRLSKWLLIQATKKIARELASKQIRVNCVVPGPTKTNMSKMLWGDNPSEWKKLIDEIPFKSANESSDIGSVIVFLLSPISKMITGSFIHVDGGWFIYNSNND